MGEREVVIKVVTMDFVVSVSSEEEENREKEEGLRGMKGRWCWERDNGWVNGRVNGRVNAVVIVMMAERLRRRMRRSKGIEEEEDIIEGWREKKESWCV